MHPEAGNIPASGFFLPIPFPELHPMNQFMFYNGEIRPATDAIASAGNRGLRYGDGVFETIKMVNGQMPLFALHAERLTNGLNILQMPLPGTDTLEQDILTLCQKNNITDAARVRVMVFRGNGSLYSVEATDPNIVIQAEPLPAAYLALNEHGWQVDTCPGVQKSCDMLANLKSNNYLPYIMAALHAQRCNLNDCLVMNAHDRICDATIANIFWVHNNYICTPPLSEGCVAGVIRRYLLQQDGYHFKETACTEDQLMQADEVFLTNALYGIRWVEKFRDKIYKCQLSAELYKQFVS
jgi:branched-chain amino acid aminotransferase